MQKELESIHPLIGFSHVIPKTPELLSKIDTTKYGRFTGSPLSFHLSALEFILLLLLTWNQLLTLPKLAHMTYTR